MTTQATIIHDGPKGANMTHVVFVLFHVHKSGRLIPIRMTEFSFACFCRRPGAPLMGPIQPTQFIQPPAPTQNIYVRMYTNQPPIRRCCSTACTPRYTAVSGRLRERGRGSEMTGIVYVQYTEEKERKKFGVNCCRKPLA